MICMLRAEMMIASMHSWLCRRILISFKIKNEKGVDNLWKGGYNKSEQNIKNEKGVNNLGG